MCDTHLRALHELWHDFSPVVRSLLILLAIAPPGEHEQETPLAEAIAISGAVECLQPEALAQRVAAWSGHESVPAGARVEIEHAPTILTMRIVGLETDDAVRTFAPPPASCADVEIAVAVALAVALDGAAIARELDAAPVPTPSPEVQRTATPAPTPASPPPERAGLRIHLAFGAGGSFAVQPGPGLEVVTEAQLRWRSVVVLAGLDLGASPSMPLGPPPGRADAVRIAGHVGVCLPVERERWDVALCELAIGGPMIASSRGIAEPRTDVVPWFATSTRFELGVAVSPRWRLVLANELVTAWVRPVIVASDPGPAADAQLRTPPLGWRGWFGARVHLGGPFVRNSRSKAKRTAVRGMDGFG